MASQEVSTPEVPVPRLLDVAGCYQALAGAGKASKTSSGAPVLQVALAAGLGPALGTLHQALELALHFRLLPGGRKGTVAVLTWAQGTAPQGCSKLCKEWHGAWQGAPRPTKNDNNEQHRAQV